jgi:hypothetical protein
MFGARQTNTHAIAEMEGAIVPTVVGNSAYRKVGPLRKLARDQLLDQGGVDFDRVPSHHCQSVRRRKAPISAFISG